MGGQFSIDRDGTCTGIVVRDGGERIIAKKSPLKSPGHDHETIIIASRRTVAPFGRGDVPGGGFDRS